MSVGATSSLHLTAQAAQAIPLRHMWTATIASLQSQLASSAHSSRSLSLPSFLRPFSRQRKSRVPASGEEQTLPRPADSNCPHEAMALPLPVPRLAAEAWWITSHKQCNAMGKCTVNAWESFNKWAKRKACRSLSCVRFLWRQSPISRLRKLCGSSLASLEKGIAKSCHRQACLHLCVRRR